jgi:hypothetical protein
MTGISITNSNTSVSFPALTNSSKIVSSVEEGRADTVASAGFETVEFIETGIITGAISAGELDSALARLDCSTAWEETVGA